MSKKQILTNAEIEEDIREQYKINCFIKIDNSDVESVCIADKHDKKLANSTFFT